MGECRKITNTEKKQVGRPPLKFPEPIPDTPENIAKAFMRSKPKTAWGMGRGMGVDESA